MEASPLRLHKIDENSEEFSPSPTKKHVDLSQPQKSGNKGRNKSQYSQIYQRGHLKVEKDSRKGSNSLNEPSVATRSRKSSTMSKNSHRSSDIRSVHGVLGLDMEAIRKDIRRKKSE
jgi:hypothetical protein